MKNASINQKEKTKKGSRTLEIDKKDQLYHMLGALSRSHARVQIFLWKKNSDTELDPEIGYSNTFIDSFNEDQKTFLHSKQAPDETPLRTDRIAAITNFVSVIYQHPNFKNLEFKIEKQNNKNYGFKATVSRYDVAYFKNDIMAKHYIESITGKKL